MRHGRRGQWMIAALAVLGAGGMAAAAQLSALSLIEPGQWQLKEAGGVTRSLCVADPRTLLQIEHKTAQCSRFVIAADAKSATVHYTCPGAGHGRTTVRVESSIQFRLQTQGILDGAPFDTEFEGHRLGACSGGRSGR